MTKAFEVNFDGLVGPTHNYSGLSSGNVASMAHRALESNPLEAVLQGLEKMKFLSDEGFKQGVLPPHERPHMETLRRLGFTGSDKKILSKAAAQFPDLLSAVTSASSMWAANAATVSPSGDTRDRRVHFTPANLISKFHRSLEASTASVIFKNIFKDPKHFTHHDPLPASPVLGDEGAANHSRLCVSHERKGVEFFVYGRHGLLSHDPEPKIFPARQTYEACSSLARNHGLDENAVVFAQQNPEAIDAGVFHNDVVGVGNRNVYFHHQSAYLNSHEVISNLRDKFQKICGEALIVIEVSAQEISLADAVKSYLFNSQLLSRPDGQMILIAPAECREAPSVHTYLQKLLGQEGQPIRHVHFFDLHQSMHNGGGPACLRLRVALTDKEFKAVNPKVLMTPILYEKLVKWAKKHYRDRLAPADLGDPQLLTESRRALDDLTEILGLGSLYDFQKT